MSALTNLFDLTTGTSGKGVDLEIYSEGKYLQQVLGRTDSRVFLFGYRTQIRSPVFEAGFQIKRHSLGEPLLGFANGPPLRRHVYVQAKRDHLLTLSENGRREFEMVTIPSPGASSRRRNTSDLRKSNPRSGNYVLLPAASRFPIARFRRADLHAREFLQERDH